MGVVKEHKGIKIEKKVVAEAKKKEDSPKQKERKKKFNKIYIFINKLGWDFFILMILTLFMMGAIETIYQNQYNEDLFQYEENLCKAFNCKHKNLTLGISREDFNQTEYLIDNNLTLMDATYFKINNFFVESIFLNFYEIGKRNAREFFFIYWLWVLLIFYNYVIKKIIRKNKIEQTTKTKRGD